MPRREAPLAWNIGQEIVALSALDRDRAQATIGVATKDTSDAPPAEFAVAVVKQRRAVGHCAHVIVHERLRYYLRGRSADRSAIVSDAKKNG
jgi:hypothetical protein